ncbi:uncharacterized protein LOC143770511 isoform X2 [Ranitomeya variabilis]|uniref:uncharacterized protein LOC143770511 isoform X2 n=1 Tax=Ranitomeya variabilis TaxID=490064 RepID=UPI004057A4CD
MMETGCDENIRFSVEESDDFIDLWKDRRPEGRNDGGVGILEPSHEEVRNQSRGARYQDEALSKTWRNVTKSFGEMFRTIRGLSLRVYNCCLEDPNFWEMLVMLVYHCCSSMKWSCKLIVVAPGHILRLVKKSRLVSSLSHFTKRKVRQNLRTFQGTDPDETRILIDGDQPLETI